MSENAFIRYLCGLAQRDDRAALARLRRGLGKPPGEIPELFPYVVPWIGVKSGKMEQDAHFLIATLFALHPQHSGAVGSIGETMRRMRDVAKTGDAAKTGGAERRFVALLNASREDLPQHLRHIVSLVRSKGIPINYELLLQHLRHWNDPERWVQRRWATDFWSERSGETESHPSEAPAGASDK